MHIRQANVQDVKLLQDLNQEVFIDNQKYDPDLIMDWATGEHGLTYFTNLLNDPDACCLVADDNGKLIGYIAAIPKDFGYRESKYIEIENMGVLPGFRSEGIGTKLIQKCFEWARSKGFQKAYVNSYFKNEQAINFYKNNGLLEIDVSLEKIL